MCHLLDLSELVDMINHLTALETISLGRIHIDEDSPLDLPRLARNNCLTFDQFEIMGDFSDAILFGRWLCSLPVLPIIRNITLVQTRFTAFKDFQRLLQMAGSNTKTLKLFASTAPACRSIGGKTGDSFSTFTSISD